MLALFGISRDRLSIHSLAVAIVLIAVATLIPGGAESGGDGLTCVFCSTFWLADAILNVLLFVPLGASFKLMRLSLCRAALYGLTYSLAIESAQLFLIAGRDPSIGDLASNTIGCSLGYSLAASMTRWLCPTHKLASQLSTTAAVGAFSVLMATGVLLQPAFTDSEYYGQWTPDLPHLERYHGAVIDARLDQHDIPPGRLEHTSSIKAALLAGAPFEIRAVAGPQASGLAPLFSIYDERGREIFLVGPDRWDLVSRYRTVAISRGLHQPSLRLPDAMKPFQDGDTLAVSVWKEGRRYCIELSMIRNCDLGFTVGSGWSLLIDGNLIPAEMTTVVNAVWVAVLLIPVGFWRGAELSSIAGGFLILLAVGIGPMFTGLLTTPLAEWIGAGAGIGTGMLLRSRTRR